MTSSQHNSPKPDHSLVKKHKPERKKRKDADQPRWSEHDYYALQWIGEQGVIRFDQLQHLLGLESLHNPDCNAVLSSSATPNTIDRWEVKRLVNSAHIVSKEPKYYWLPNAGFQFVELNLPHYSPKKFDMPYVKWLDRCAQEDLKSVGLLDKIALSAWSGNGSFCSSYDEANRLLSTLTQKNTSVLFLSQEKWLVR